MKAIVVCSRYGLNVTIDEFLPVRAHASEKEPDTRPSPKLTSAKKGKELSAFGRLTGYVDTMIQFRSKPILMLGDKIEA